MALTLFSFYRAKERKMNAEIKKLIESVKDDVLKWRRHLHQYPEVAFTEYKTVEYIKSELSPLKNAEIYQLHPLSVEVLIKGAKPGKRIAFRADIDALPVEEQSGEPFSSKNKGIMHACGHDSHTAILMGAVKIVSQIADKIKGEVLFIFQHAEELPPGGADLLVKKGVLKGVDMIFGIHVDPSSPSGTLNYSNGVFSASTDNFDITVEGRGAHGSMPHKSIDPIVIGSQIVSALQTIVSRRISPYLAPVVTVATFVAQGEYNVIPDNALIRGTMRTHNKEVCELIPKLVEKTVKGICDIYGASYKFVLTKGYPIGINADEAVAVAKSSIEKYLSPVYEAKTIEKPMFGGEDFSFYQEQIPGAFFFYGAARKDIEPITLHSSKFRIDEEAMQSGTAFFTSIVFTMLID
jgi:amidohydrolase